MCRFSAYTLRVDLRKLALRELREQQALLGQDRSTFA
jgi:hypothetical protein